MAILIVTGCKPSPSQAPTVMRSTAPAEPTEPAVVELSEPVVTVTPAGILKFKFQYAFVKGEPSLNYMCDLAFPGTTNVGQKPLQHWELKKSGVIQGTIELQSLDPPVQGFEITFGEAEVPQSGFRSISNKLTGTVDRS